MLGLTFAQLLNRNPQNRLGARLDAAELKEHPFFKTIDWDLLYRKQITPPFKPIVDSDESVANFDPEFTNSSLQDAGIAPWQHEEPSGPPQPVRHSYVGPGGSLSSASSLAKAGMAINKVSRPPLSGGSNSPLTSSLQEKFRGFTYTGESIMVSHSLSLNLAKRRDLTPASLRPTWQTIPWRASQRTMTQSRTTTKLRSKQKKRNTRTRTRWTACAPGGRAMLRCTEAVYGNTYNP